jgi:NADPH2:quinone reductase
VRMGAAAAVDYTDPDWVSQAADACGGTGPRVVFDGVGGELGQAAFAGMADGGRFSAHGAAAGGFARPDPEAARGRGIAIRGIEQAQLDPGRHARFAAQAMADAAADRIRPVIGQVFPLDQAAAAHEAIGSRAVTAKTLLRV